MQRIHFAMLLLGCLSIAVASPSLRLEEVFVDSKMDEQNLWDFSSDAAGG